MISKELQHLTNFPIHANQDEMSLNPQTHQLQF